MELELELAGKITATTFSKGGIDTQVPSVDRVPIIPTSSNRMYTSIKINDGKTEGQTVSTSPKNFDGQTTTNVKKDVDAYFNAVFLGGESKNYNKFVSTDLGKAKSELSQYFSDSLQYSYD